MFEVILLPVLLSACLHFQPVAGDCYDSTYKNCLTCYQTLAHALIDTGDNKYILYDGFYPPDATSPVLVEVTYRFEGCDNCRKRWYWTEGTFYIYQPLEVFMFRSLLFAPFSMRQASVELNLPNDCKNSSDGFLKMLTQKLKAYAMHQTATPRIDNSYVAKAVSGEKIDIKEDNLYGHSQNVKIYQLLQCYQILPFIVIFLLLAGKFCLLCSFCCLKSPREALTIRFSNIIKDPVHQASIAAIVAVCSCLTIYTFALDVMSFIIEKNVELPSYYDNSLDNIIYHGFFSTISVLCLLCGFFSLIGLCCVYAKCSEEKKLTMYILIFVIFVYLCVASAVLSLSFHLPNILIAWTTDPIYASRITVYYGIVIFVYYHTFKNTYSLSHLLKYCVRMREEPFQEGDAEGQRRDEWVETTNSFFCITKVEKNRQTRMQRTSHIPSDEVAVCLGIVFLVLVGALLVGFHALNVMFFYFIPINRSIEESVHGVQALYDGTVVLIGALIAYNVVWFYLSMKKFSAEKAFKRAMKEMTENPFDMNNGWRDLSEEDRMVQIIKDFLHHEAH